MLDAWRSAIKSNPREAVHFRQIKVPTHATSAESYGPAPPGEASGDLSVKDETELFAVRKRKTREVLDRIELDLDATKAALVALKKVKRSATECYGTYCAKDFLCDLYITSDEIYDQRSGLEGILEMANERFGDGTDSPFASDVDSDEDADQTLSEGAELQAIADAAAQATAVAEGIERSASPEF